MRKTQFAAVVVSFLALCSCAQSPEALVKRGNELFKGGKYEEASINFRKAMQKDVNFGWRNSDSAADSKTDRLRWFYGDALL